MSDAEEGGVRLHVRDVWEASPALGRQAHAMGPSREALTR